MAITKTVFDVVKDSIKPYIDSQIATLSNVRAELGAHNLIDINAYLTLSNTSIANNGIVSTATDSRNASIYFRCFKGSTAVGNALINQDISTGQFSKEITIPSNYDFDLISIGHNGASKDLKVSLPFSKTGTFIFSCNVTGANTSVSGGYALEDIMLRLADDKSTVYGEFSKPNTELTKDDSGLTANAFANGAVNLLENTKSSAVAGGITYTVNDDKSVLINAGTAQDSSDSLFVIKSSADYWKLPAGRYKLSGAPSGTDITKIVLNGNIILTEGGIQLGTDSGNGIEFEITDSMVADANYRISVYIKVPKGKTVSNTLIKPMITLADVPNSDYAHYVPYAKSNKELTELGIKSKEVTMTTNANGNGMISTSDIPFSAIVLSAIVSSGTNYGAVASPYLSTGNNCHAIHVFGIDGTNLANTQIICKVYYVDKI